MLIEWWLERRGVYIISFYKVGKSQNIYKKKDGKGGEALRGWNSNMTLSHKKDGKLWLSYFQCRSEIQMKKMLIIMFWKIDNKKIEEKGNVQKTLTITLFDFVAFRCRISLFVYATFGCHVSLWISTPFDIPIVEGCIWSSWNWKKERDDNDINKKMKWKSSVSWMKRSKSRRDNKETNKTMVGEELLEKRR
jgi:hypothetical protein